MNKSYWWRIKWGCDTYSNGPQLRSVPPPPPYPLVAEAGVLHEARVYVSLGVFPPTVLHPILHNKGTWGNGVKWEWAHEWKGTNWHVAFCEVGAQPLDRWLPFANEHCSLGVSAFLPASLQNVLSPPWLCAGPEWPADHRCAVNWETHTSVIKAAGGLVLYQSPFFKASPPLYPSDHCAGPVLPLAVLSLSNDAFWDSRPVSYQHWAQSGPSPPSHLTKSEISS